MFDETDDWGADDAVTPMRQQRQSVDSSRSLPPTQPASPQRLPLSSEGNKRRRTEAESTAAATTHNRRNNMSLAALNTAANSTNARVHKPGDAAFRFTCVLPDSTHNRKSSYSASNKFDDTFAAGDAWGSNVCHCMTCEMHTAFGVVAQTEAAGVVLPASSPSLSSSSSLSTVAVPPTVVLWDLDNFGFNHLKQEAVRIAGCTSRALSSSSGGDKNTNTKQQQQHQPATTKRQGGGGEKRTNRSDEGGDDSVLLFLRNTVFWFFYGACFSRRHGTMPPEHVQSLLNDDSSVWGLLYNQSRVVFTPCAGHAQAADEVMVAISLGLFPQQRTTTETTPPFPTILATRDKGLNDTVGGLQRDHTVTAVKCVNPQSSGGTLVPFWGELVAQSEIARQEYAHAKLSNNYK